jgi:ANTAR domain-containing protein/GAF domain-containing protein
MSHADMWEAGADERERLADERERLADEREALADDRDWLADRHEHDLTRREAQRSTRSSVSDAVEEQEAARAAVHRAEAALRRAEAELLRATRVGARVEARAHLRGAASERTESAQDFEQATDYEARAWLVDRREFVAAEREAIADDRDAVADQRDEMAAARENLADQREHETLERERDIERHHQAGRSVSAAQLSASEQWQRHADMRAKDGRRRDSAATTRRAAAEARAHAVAAWGPQAYGPMLLGSFAKLAGEMFASEELTDVLPQVLKFTVDMVAGCDCASITQWRHERVLDTVASDPVAAELDDVQFGSGLGPGPEALQSRDPVYTPRLVESGRWPVLAAAAEQYRVASAVSHGLFIRQPGQWSALGVFTLYSQTPDAFGEEDLEFGSILAAFVAVAVAQSRRSADVDRREAALHRALSTRDVIGQAKGILMERQRLSAGQAFDLLRHASQRLNRKVTEVAHDLAETGEIPT